MNSSEKSRILTELLKRIDDLRPLNHTKQEFKDWREEVELHLREFYGEDNEYFKRFKRIVFFRLRFVLERRGAPEVDSCDKEAFDNGLNEAGVVLRAAIKREELYPRKEKPEEKRKEKRPEFPVGEKGAIVQIYITQSNQNFNITDITLDQYVSQVQNPEVKQLLERLNEEAKKPDTKWETIGNILKRLSEKGTEFLIQAVMCLIKSQLGI